MRAPFVLKSGPHIFLVLYQDPVLLLHDQNFKCDLVRPRTKGGTEGLGSGALGTHIVLCFLFVKLATLVHVNNCFFAIIPLPWQWLSYFDGYIYCRIKLFQLGFVLLVP